MVENATSSLRRSAQMLLDKQSAPLLLTNQESKIIFANEAAAALVGYSPTRLQEQHWAGLDARLTVIQWRMHWENLTEGTPHSYQSDLLTASQQLRPVSVRVQRLDTTHALIELEDLLEADASRQELEILSETLQAGTFFYDLLSNELHYSPQTARLLRLPPGATATEAITILQQHLDAVTWQKLCVEFKEASTSARNVHAAINLQGPADNSPRLLIDGRSAGNALHVTHIFGSIRQEQQTSFTIAGEITEELARFSIDQALEMIFWTRPDGSIAYANQVVGQKLGYSQEQLRSGSVKLIAPYFDATYRDAFWDKLRKEKFFTAVYEVYDSNGDPVPISANVNYLQFGKEEYACSFCRDLTQLKKRNTLIELSRSALDHSTNCILWLDAAFCIRFINQQVTRLLGQASETFIGNSWQDIFPLLPREVIENGDATDITVTDKSGKQRYFELRCDVLDHEGERFYVLTGHDISARVKRERKLQKAYEEIQTLKERAEQENISLREEVNTNFRASEIITVSPGYRKVLQQINQVAEVDTTVLIMGETGTGKELLARAIHRISDRENRPLIKVNCAALPESLIESELFGHEKGAFTGAISQKKGRFELADGGTLFLDEVGEMPLELQAKLLRVLQEDEFERLGGTKTIRVDVRLVAATNRDLAKMVEEGRFRADLYYRLNVFPIVNPPLRKRPEDIPVLAQHFSRKFARRQGKPIEEIDRGDLQKLQQYDFPGNIRELENLIERAVVLCQSTVLRIPLSDRRPSAAEVTAEKAPLLPFAQMQRQHIIRALKATGGRITGPEGAGNLLELNDRTLMSKIRKMKIQKREYLV